MHLSNYCMTWSWQLVSSEREAYCLRGLRNIPWEKLVGVLVPADSSGRQPGPHQAEYDFLQERNVRKCLLCQWTRATDEEGRQKYKSQVGVSVFQWQSVREMCGTCLICCVCVWSLMCVSLRCSSPSRAAKHGRCCVLSPSCLAASDSRYWCVVRFLPFQLSLSACEEK